MIPPGGHHDLASAVDAGVHRIGACAQHSEGNHYHQQKMPVTRSQPVQRNKPNAPMAAPAMAVNGVYRPMAKSNPMPTQIAVTQ